MRKVLLIGTAAVLSAAMTVGVIFAQNSTAQPWLGIRVAETNSQVVITQVQAGSPAADANLLVNDVIVTFNTDPITSTAELAKDVQAATVGESVAVDVLRAGSPLTVDVTLGSSPSAAPQTVPGSRNNGNNGNGAFTLDPVGFAERLLQANLSEVDNGYQVTGVADAFNPFGLQVDDVVTSLNGQDIKSLDLNTLRSALQSSASPSLTLDVLRGGVDTTLNAALDFGFRGGDDDGGQFGGNGNVPGQFNRPGRGDFGGDNNFGDDDNFGGDDGGSAPQTQPQTTPPPISLGNT